MYMPTRKERRTAARNRAPIDTGQGETQVLEPTQDIVGVAAEGLSRIQQSEALDLPEGVVDHEPPRISAEERVETARRVIAAFHEMADLVGGLVSDQEAGETFENFTRMPDFPIHVRGLVPEPQPRMPQERLDLRIRIPAKWQAVCPKRPGTDAYLNWKCYIDGMTLGAYLADNRIIGGRRRARRDVAWDVEHGFVELQDPSEWAAEQTSSLEEQTED